MIGDSSDKRQRGQVLLIGVMLVAVVLTVVFSASFVSRTDTQISKLEEENQKALAAAESGIEAALKQGNVANLSTLNIPAGFTGSATVSTTASTSFISPLIQANGQYTFYMSAPRGSADKPDFTLLTPSWRAGQLTVCSTSSNFALSLTFMRTDNFMKRFTINPPGNTIVQNGTSANGLGACPSGETWAYKHQFTATDMDNIRVDSTVLLLIRLVGSGAGSKIGFTGNGGDIPLQGRTIVSEASSPTGVSKKVQLFQSYPQIPSEFFLTSF